jgi:lipopolysaccharide/colanic/teichoic acid biosynthesis glycosyltransferase
MDVLTLPQTVRKDRRISWYSFRYSSLTRKRNFKFIGSYFIGKEASNLDKLAGIYSVCRSAERLETAKAELLDMLDDQEGVLPEVIFCESSFDLNEVAGLRLFLQAHDGLKGIPLILAISGLSEKEVACYRTHVRPDEIIYLDSCDEVALSHKVRFLRKMKAAHHRNVLPQIEERHPENHLFAFGFGSKRMFDILCASLALLALSPLFLLIALAILIETRGPVFYISKRAGRGYRIFKFIKFRTMVQGADKRVDDLTHLNQYAAINNPVFFKVSNDPRITRVGRILRNTSLDELPQLLNVLWGDMSLVGNRPLPLYEAAKLTTDDYAARFLAPAGITGLWQVKKRGSKDMSAEERISIDIDYAAKCSFATDLWIIVNTPSALLQKENV